MASGDTTHPDQAWAPDDAIIWAAIAATIGNGHWYTLPTIQGLCPGIAPAELARVVGLAVGRHLVAIDRSRTPVRYQLAS